MDRKDISWPTTQIDLIIKLAALSKPLVVVVLGDMPGQNGGSAVMNVISGAASVAGRLSITKYPANYTALPMLDMNLRSNSSSPGRTYRWYDKAVRPIGFGLHYTTFTAKFTDVLLTHNIHDMLENCTNQYPDTCAAPALSVAVSNTGDRTSDFVALAFIQGEAGPKPYPHKTLISYAKLRGITGGTTKTAQLGLTLGNLARVDESGNTVLYPGEYTLMLDEPTQAELKLTLTGSEVVLDK
ncbi:hypothetical protein EK21DRAFT_102778 [Setomelanomma holmii]|uniref:Fibronectin type III-like domain-containing protein n=1 Tax=Setomelanomma holmii TaxID=210430 RepID=A0A9P4LK00_9PLEO|nr:hypothetical protein EK21DRAFT_102778 [Setomelanomma holmii]